MREWKSVQASKHQPWVSADTQRSALDSAGLNIPFGIFAAFPSAVHRGHILPPTI